MSNLTSFSIIQQKVNKIQSELKLDSKGIAFDRLALQIILRLNEDEIEEAITDGPQDGEVDAIYIIDRNVHIFTFKYTDSFDKTKSNYPETELDQFNLTIQNLLSKNIIDSTVNTAILDKYLEILYLFEEGPLNFKFYVVSNKQKPVAHAARKFENAISQFRYTEIFYYDLEDLVKRLLEDRYDKVDGKIRFIDKQHFEKSNGPLKTVIGSVGALDLIELIKKDSQNEELTLNEAVFNENIRAYKAEHRVNKAIIKSALDSENYQFFYLNNGISILCEDCGYTPNTRSPIVTLKNFQIINGGQTSHSLFDAYKTNPDQVANVEILVRICVAKKEDPISDKIGETTNNQIPVGSRDLHSNDYVQKKLQEDFLELGYYYERKPNQYETEPTNRIINNELLGQVYLAYFLDQPSEARNSKAGVFGEKYDDIFKENGISAKMLLPVINLYNKLLKLKREIQNKKRKKESINENEAFVSRATFHILTAIKVISEKENLDLNNDNDIDKAIETAIKYIFELVQKTMESRGSLYTHDKFFKEIPTSKLVLGHITSKYPV